MKKPCGRRVSTATCMPGLPKVVRFFTNSSSFPALGPVKTCTTATCLGAPACGAAAEAETAGCAGFAGAAAWAGAAGTSWCASNLPVLSTASSCVGLLPACVCIKPCISAGLFAAGAGVACLTGARRTIVFSKSAGLVWVTWSLMYFSLYLPISITSLFCRKCFLVGFPFTSSPLVLSRSSRKESCKMVTIAACSPLTAKLSMAMSLCALRPMVMRSLLRGYSLIITPSMLSINFAAIVVTLVLNYFSNQLSSLAANHAARQICPLPSPVSPKHYRGRHYRSPSVSTDLPQAANYSATHKAWTEYLHPPPCRSNRPNTAGKYPQPTRHAHGFPDPHRHQSRPRASPNFCSWTSAHLQR